MDVEVGVKATLDIILNAGPECNGRFRDIKVEGSVSFLHMYGFSTKVLTPRTANVHRRGLNLVEHKIIIPACWQQATCVALGPSTECCAGSTTDSSFVCYGKLSWCVTVGYMSCQHPALTLSTTVSRLFSINILFHQQPRMLAFTEAEMAQSNTEISLHALHGAFDDINRLIYTVYTRSQFYTFREFMLYNVVACTPINS